MKKTKAATDNTAPEKKVQGPASVRHKVFTVLGTVLCVILIPILLINVTEYY